MALKLAAVVLAAGSSRRYGPQNKLLQDWNGQPMVRHVVDTVQESRVAEEIVVVTGWDGDAVEVALEGFQCVRNPIWDTGMGLSLAVGVAACQADGYLVVLGDMPYVSAETLRRLREAWEAYPTCPVVPGRVSPPLIVPSHYRRDIFSLVGDEGCRAFLKPGGWIYVDTDPEELRDVDTR